MITSVISLSDFSPFGIQTSPCVPYSPVPKSPPPRHPPAPVCLIREARGGGGGQAEARAFDPVLRAEAPAAEETDKLIHHGSFQKDVTSSQT